MELSKYVFSYIVQKLTIQQESIGRDKKAVIYGLLLKVEYKIVYATWRFGA
jgi:hypothetical protein